MVKKDKVCLLTILAMLIIFVQIASVGAIDVTPPASITSLSVASYGATYIKWKWVDPTTSDFDHVDVYINGIFRDNVSKGVKYYNATGLIPYTTYKISTHTVDISGNINQTWKNSSRKTAKDSIPPGTVTNLYASNIGTSSIKWKWTDPSDIDFTKVMIYINGIFKTNVTKGIQSYTAKSLSPDTNYKISTRTVDTSGNIGIWTNDTEKTDSISPIPTSTPIPTPGGGGNGSGTIRFVTIGDTHITANISKDEYKNFTRAVDYINNMTDVDFIVELGDITEDAQLASFTNAKYILNKSNKPYYVINGNHDGMSSIYSSCGDYNSSSNYGRTFGRPDRIVPFGSYQLVFVGICALSSNGTWKFPNGADYNAPTLIFNHGPVQPKPISIGGDGTCSGWGSTFAYACNMTIETNKFTNLTAYYAGHVHRGTNQTIGNTLYVTEDNLGGAVIGGPNSQYIGYTVVQDGRVVNYSTVHY